MEMDTWGQASKFVARTLAIAPENSLSWPVKGKLRRAFSDRLILSEAIDAVGRMIDAYPNGRASITDSYIGNMANLLCQYPRTVALGCADPIRGVPTKTNFIPTVADVVKWCEPLTSDMQQTVRREDRIAEQLRDREAFEREFPSAPPRATPHVEFRADGKHQPGTILSNYSEALRLYGRPVGAFEPDRSKPYNTRTNQG